MRKIRIAGGFVVGLGILFIAYATQPVSHMKGGCGPGPEQVKARNLGDVLFCYSTDNTKNNNAYPNGASSTEVFQKMLDDGYVNDPTIFYLPLPGKVQPILGRRLRPENVCFDLTAGVDPKSSGELPIVFETGFRVTYAAGASAVRLGEAISTDSYGYHTFPLTLTEWWCGKKLQRTQLDGIAVCYKSRDSRFAFIDKKQIPAGSIPNFVPPDFKPDGKTYRQLTPEGELK